MSGLTGTSSLLRLAMRRDRLVVPASILLLVVFMAGSAQATLALYPDPTAGLGAMKEVISNPALVALYGPLSDPENIDAFATFKTIVLGAVFVCLLAYAVVRRHTRTEEEEGRLELLGAGVVGRRAPLAAAVLLGTVAVLVTSLLAAISGISVGLDATGSVAFGVAWLTVGLTWVGITAVSAQLTETARGTAGFALGALALAYLIRVIGDTAPEGSPLTYLSWLSPLGWVEKVSAFGENNLWVGLLGLAAYAVLVAVAVRILDHRDLGAGVLPSRPGPDRGTMRTPLDLARRLGRGPLIGWMIGFVVGGSVVGSVAENVQDLFKDQAIVDMLEKMGGIKGSFTDVYVAAEFGFVAVAAAAFGIALALRLRAEESLGRSEAVLATATRRDRWAFAVIGVAVASTALVMAAMGLVVGLIRGAQTGDVGHQVASILGAAMSTLPAVWVCVGIAVALFGVAPKYTGYAWAALIAFLTIGEFGELLGLPTAVMWLSPFWHLPKLPGAAVEWPPLAVLTGIAAALILFGVSAYRRRDVLTG